MRSLNFRDGEGTSGDDLPVGVTARSPQANSAGAQRVVAVMVGYAREEPDAVRMLSLCCDRNGPFNRGIFQMGRWFGTEGSEVQILAPRPIPQKSSGNLESSVCQVTRFWCAKSSCQNRVLRASNAALRRNWSTLHGHDAGFWLKPLCSPYADCQHPLAP